ncbi:ribosome maturation factor RimM, partial [Saccharopolyspora sp. NPDC002686]|uniref:ribosome maturation factor RimM n=1 Tax=Saccharopolyspora sp. NPDC002686 TaxID=3154541 RepID=UPI0033296332
DGREAAEDLRGVTLTVTADVLEPTDDPDEFHDHELVGLRAVQVSGEEVGEVSDVVHTPAGELLALRTADDREVLVPFVAEIVPEIDLAAGKLVVDPPEGLLDE